MSLLFHKSLKIIHSSHFVINGTKRFLTCSSPLFSNEKLLPKKELRTEKLKYLGDPDTFGTLANPSIVHDIKGDEDEIKEEQFLQEQPIRNQRLTIRQYADLMKQYIKHKRLKEALNVLEVRMLKEDRVKPENYIYNILIGAFADVGYAKKAFKLFNDMKKRALKPTGATYTCLFEACARTPQIEDGLKRATKLKNLMDEKGIEPNLTNYNAMIKSFGRCSDLPTAFRIVDEMIAKKIKIRVHTFNHLLQACISDKESGLRYAVLVWRKMLVMKEKPNIYSFNLMLRCVQNCQLGSKEEIEELVKNIKKLMPVKPQVEISFNKDLLHQYQSNNIEPNIDTTDIKALNTIEEPVQNLKESIGVKLEFIDKNSITKLIERTVPNFLSKEIRLDGVLSFNEVVTPRGKFAIIGGQDDFFKEMNVYAIKPDIKTFSLMLPLLENTEAEIQVMEYMKKLKVKPSIDFFNILMKERCLRKDYEGALEVKKLIKKADKNRHPFNKKHKVRANIMTYGILALTCTTKEKAEELLCEMKENRLRVNIQIIGALLSNATTFKDFSYIHYILNVMDEEQILVNEKVLKKLEMFNRNCLHRMKVNQETEIDEELISNYKTFNEVYTNLLKNINIEEVLKEEDPFKQFEVDHPNLIQTENVKIREPKKFYKRNRKYVRYTLKI